MVLAVHTVIKITVNGNQANAFGDGNTVAGAYAQAFGDANTAKGTNAIAYGYNQYCRRYNYKLPRSYFR